jgi:CarD family transcriptional regulator
LKDTRSSIKDTLKASSKIPEKNNNKENLKQNQKLLFSPGDFVVYPTHGVGRVTNVEMQEIAGYKLKLFVISFDEDRMTLRVPIAKASTSGLRKLTSRKKMDVALETLKGRARVKRTMWSRRAQEYEAKINSGDPLAIAEVVRDLHRKTGQPEQSFSERQIFESACHRLAMELAAIEKIDVEAATEKMEDLLKAA